MVAGGLLGDHQRLSDPGVGHSQLEQPQHLGLARRQLPLAARPRARRLAQLAQHRRGGVRGPRRPGWRKAASGAGSSPATSGRPPKRAWASASRASPTFGHPRRAKAASRGAGTQMPPRVVRPQGSDGSGSSARASTHGCRKHRQLAAGHGHSRRIEVDEGRRASASGASTARADRVASARRARLHSAADTAPPRRCAASEAHSATGPSRPRAAARASARRPCERAARPARQVGATIAGTNRRGLSALSRACSA